MKMVKSLLLGSAAGLVAVAGAQAADLPVKAKPVEYVKVCSLYGAGYYYMPGTDICLKLGGYVRYQHTLNGGNGTQPFGVQGWQEQTRNTEGQFQRARAVATIDTRQQTAYGTLRTYWLVGFSQDNAAAAGLYATRGFIQIAGFTFGKATSFFDLFPGASFSYNSGMIHSSDTGDAGHIVAAYTAQFGNGFSATISAEQNRRAPTINASNNLSFNIPTGTGAGAIPIVANNLASQFPDVVRLDQAWGTVMVSGALADASGGYYGTAVDAGLGHPDNKLGWAVMGGFIFNLPMIGQGDRLAAHVTYTEGALRYASNNAGTGLVKYSGNEVGFGFGTSGVFTGTTAATGTGVNLTTAWSTAAAFEHFWTPALRTSVYGSYLNVSHNAQATAAICTMTTADPAWAAGCSPDFSMWSVGSRTQWEPVRGLIMGVDVIYQKLNSARASATNLATLGNNGAQPAGVYTVADQDNWTGTFRIQRDFLP
jgi:hypothetical protein